MRLHWCLLGAATCLLATAAQADNETGLHGAVGVAVQHDNNLFRLPDSATPADVGVTRGSDDEGSQRADTITSPFISLDGSIALGRQRFGLAVSRRETRLARYSAYDSQTGDSSACWDWQLGNQFDGRVDAGRSEQASQFQDFIGSRRNLLTVRNEHASANWRPRPDRRVTLDVQRYRGSNDTPARATNDYTVRTTGLEGAWVTALGTEWTLRWRNTNGSYPNRTIVETVPIDNSYRQHDSDIGVVLHPGGRTRGELRLGYAVRHHDQVPQRDFEGPSGRAALAWQASGALLLDVEAVRDLNALDDYDRLFAITTRYATGAHLAVSAQWQIGLRWTQENVDYGGDPQNVLTQAFGQSPPRHDRTRTARFALTWLPADRVQVELSFEQSRRASSLPGQQYADPLAGLSTQYSF